MTQRPQIQKTNYLSLHFNSLAANTPTDKSIKQKKQNFISSVSHFYFALPKKFASPKITKNALIFPISYHLLLL